MQALGLESLFTLQLHLFAVYMGAVCACVLWCVYGDQGTLEEVNSLLPVDGSQESNPGPRAWQQALHC